VQPLHALATVEPSFLHLGEVREELGAVASLIEYESIERVDELNIGDVGEVVVRHGT
jgi:hypothetical protein